MMHPDHTGIPGECRTTSIRQPASAPRRGRHPRPPHEAAIDDPVADLQPELPGDLGDLGAEEERQAQQRADDDNDINDDDDEEHERTTRPRKKYANTGTGPDHTPNWTRFDINSSLQAWRSASEHVCKRILRKLHLRW